MNLSKQIRSKHHMLVFTLLVVVCFFLSGCNEKAQEKKKYRVGILCGLSYLAGAADGFKVKMTELGYVEGKNITYENRKTDFDMAVYKNTLKKFVADKVDLIFVFPTEAAQEAKAAIQGANIPVVFTLSNIEGTGLVKSVGKPGGNITGVRYPVPDIALQRFEIMCELAPQAKRIWIPYQRGYATVAGQLEVLLPAAASAGITLEEGPANDTAELKALLDVRAKSTDIGMDAILFLAEPLTVTPDAFLVMGEFAAKHKIPIAGALMVVGDYESVFGLNADIATTGKQAAVLADKILKGTPAGSIAVVSTRPYFRLNYKAAQELGLNVSKGLLSKADEIIR